MNITYTQTHTAIDGRRVLLQHLADYWYAYDRLSLRSWNSCGCCFETAAATQLCTARPSSRT